MAGQPPQVDGDCGRGCDETGDEGFKPVTHLFVTHPVELIHLSYRRESGSAGEDADSKLVGTRVHPFWSVDRASWVDMGELREGERLWLLDGSFATVTRVQVEHAPCAGPAWQPGMAAKGTLGTAADPQTGTFTTYNFEVATWHTYFAAPVGTSSTHAAIWVHNLNVGACPDIKDLMRRMKDKGVPRNVRERVWESHQRLHRLDDLAWDKARGKRDYHEAAGGLRIEQTGRVVQRGQHVGVDFIVDGVPTALKGPIHPTKGSADGLAKSVLKDINQKTGTSQVYVDLHGLTPQQAQSVKATVLGGPNNLRKRIFFLEP